MSLYTYAIYTSDNPKKKYKVYVPDKNGKIHKVQFGAAGYEDYTMHGDKQRLENYKRRHAGDHLDDPLSPGFWSYHLLWNLPTLEASYNDILQTYNFRPELIK
jgi:hypothetical protein